MSLPTVEGFVHGIVAVDPVYVVQCDGCSRVAKGDTRPDGTPSLAVIQFCGIQFGPQSDPRRLCGRCRVDAGWDDYETKSLRPADLELLESWMQDGAA